LCKRVIKNKRKNETAITSNIKIKIIIHMCLFTSSISGITSVLVRFTTLFLLPEEEKKTPQNLFIIYPSIT
jgi:hypothetical protein